MPYIGKEPVAGNFVLLDSITTSATATYALTKDSVAYSPESARNMIVSLNGVTQAPETAFTVSGSNITFSSALTASDVIDYILVLGDVLSVGTPSDGTVGTSQMSYPLGNFSSTGIDDNATSTAITIDSSENVGIGTASPASLLELEGADPIITLDDTSAGGYAQVQALNGSLILMADEGASVNNSIVRFDVDGTERMRIDSSGNVGIGVSSPTEKLHMSGNALVGGEVESVASGTTTGFKWGQDTATHYWKWAEFNNQTASLQENSTSSSFSRISVAAGGNVGIGTTAPAQLLDVSGTAVFGGSTTRLTTYSDSTYSGIFNGSSLTSNEAVYMGANNIFFAANGGTLRITGHSFYRQGSFGSGIHISTNTILPANENGSVSDNTESLGNSTYRWKDLYLSGGAYLGGTGAANHLDDYEEGTWTPSIASGSASFFDATYTKVGRLVTVSCLMISITDLSSSTALQINGLPFTTNSSTIAVSVGLSRYFNRGNGTIVAYSGGNSNVVNFYALSAGADYLNVRHSDLNNANVNYYLNLTYQTT